jgi:hypothetical protein
MKKLFYVLCLLILSACNQSSSTITKYIGALVYSQVGEPFVAEKGAPPTAQQACENGPEAIRVGDEAALIISRLITSFDSNITYERAIQSFQGTHVCLIHTSGDTCGDGPASGCSNDLPVKWIWVALNEYYSGKPMNWQSNVIHELTHIIARTNNIPTSNNHTEPIHKIFEPTVQAEWTYISKAPKSWKE